MKMVFYPESGFGTNILDTQPYALEALKVSQKFFYSR